MNCIRAGISLTILFFIGVPTQGQFSVAIEAPLQEEWCSGISYDIRIENLDDAAEKEISIEFNEPVLLLNTSFDQDLVAMEARVLTLNLQTLDACSFLKGSITVIPECNEFLAQLIAVPHSPELGPLTSIRTNLNTVLLSLAFDEYHYDGPSGTLSKSLTVRNIGSMALESFIIDLDYGNDFAALASSNLGTINSDNQLIVSNGDLPQGVLNIRESITIELTHDLIGCRIGPVQYNIHTTCELNECMLSNFFIDDNEVDLFLPSLEIPQMLNYGLCNYTYNEIVIRQDQFSTSSTLSNVLDISTVLKLKNNLYPFGACLDFDFRVNGIQVNYEERDERLITVNFSSLMNDPDGPGGLRDIDGDGSYNDLANGDSILLEVGIRALESCSANDSNVPFTISGAGADLCGDILESNAEFTQVLVIPRLSTSSWSFLPEDNNGISFLELGDSIDWVLNINPFSNEDPECSSPEWIIDISIPQSLTWIEDLGIIYEGPTDTFLVDGVLSDTTLSFSNVGLVEGQFRVTFEAICPENPYINFNPDIDVNEQCLEWRKFNLAAHRTWNCNNENICERSIISAPSYSTGHRVVCSEEEELISQVSLDTVEFRRVNGGWMDSARTEKWDPDIHGELANNIYFYDHDTMRFRIPFQLDSIAGLNSFSLFVDKKRRSQSFEMNVVSSTLYNYERSDSIQRSRNVRPLTDRTNRSISLNIRRAEYGLLEIQDGDSLMWEVEFIIDVERVTIQETISFVPEELRVYAEENKNNCIIRGLVQEFSFHISEVLIPRLQTFGRGTNIFTVGSSQSITMSIKPDIFTFQDTLAYEYRPGTEYASWFLTVPLGYELVNDELEIPESLQFDTLFGFFTYTRDTLVATVVTETATTITYEFQFDPDLFQNTSISEGFSLAANIRLICPPVSPQAAITITGTGTYIDYYQGSLSSLPLMLDQMLIPVYLPDNYQALDGFIVADGRNNSYWEIIDRNSLGGFGDPFAAGNGFTGQVIEYLSDQITIDSISECQFQYINPDSAQIVSYLYDSIAENRFYLRQPSTLGSDEFFNFSISKSLILHFSNQKCGYDTVFLQMGSPTFWEEGCLHAADMDTLVVYTPMGIPEVRWIEEPDELYYCETNTLTWTLRNVGEGGLQAPAIQLEMPQLENATLLITTTTSSIDGSELLRYSNSGYYIPLTELNIDTLSGTRDSDQESIRFDLWWEPFCELPTTFNASIQGEGVSFCGDSVSSQSLLLEVPAFSIYSDTAFQMSMVTFSDEACGDEIKYRVEIMGDPMEMIRNDSIILFLPKGQVFLNAIQTDTREVLDNARITTQGDFQILSWRGILTLNEASTFSFEVIMQNTCLDVCSDHGEARAVLLSSLDIECQQETCSRYILRADSGWDQYDWRSEIMLEADLPRIIDQGPDPEIMEVSWRMEQENNHIYEGLVMASYFNDLNGNGILDIGDDLFEVKNHQFDDSNILEVSDTITSSGISICELGLHVEIEESCTCILIDPIIFNQELGTSTEIFLCTDDIYEFQLRDIDSECQTNWANHRNVDQSNPNQVIYNSVGITFFPDTVIQFTNCNNCSIQDTFIFQLETIDLGVEEITPLCGNTGAQLRAVLDESTAEPIRYRWSVDTTQEFSEIEVNVAGLVTVEVFLPSGCVLSESYEVIREEPRYDLIVTLDPCVAGEGAMVELVSDQAIEVMWSDSNAQLIRQDLGPGTYTLEISDSTLCSTIDTVVIAPYTELSEVQYPSLLTGELGGTLAIQPLSQGDQEYTADWEPSEFFSCDTCISTTLLSVLDTMIQVVITDALGCSVVKDIIIQTNNSFQITLPNIFNPNSSSQNSIFFPSTDPSVFRIKNFQILDRWGNIIFLRENLAPDDSTLGWNGNRGDLLASSGVYVYFLEVELINGTIEKVIGTVALVR